MEPEEELALVAARKDKATTMLDLARRQLVDAQHKVAAWETKVREYTSLTERARDKVKAKVAAEK